MVEHVISQEPLGSEGTQPSLTVFVVRVDSGEMQVMSGWPRSPGSLVGGSWLWTVPGERAAGGLLEHCIPGSWASSGDRAPLHTFQPVF